MSGNAERAVEDAAISFLKRKISSINVGGKAIAVGVGRWQALSEEKAGLKMYVNVEPFSDFNWNTDVPHGKIPLNVIVSTFFPDDADRETLDEACAAFEDAWASASPSDLSESGVFTVDGIVKSEGKIGFNDQGFQQKVFGFELFGHKS